MTDLQLSLLGLGAAVIGGVVAFNWWQEYRYRQKAAAVFAKNQPDVLLETPKNMVRPGKAPAQRLEPTLAQDVMAAETGGAAEPRLQPLKRAFERPEEVEEDEVAVAAAILDPSLDFIAQLHAGEMISAKQIPVFNLGKRVQIIGLRDDEQWVVVAASSAGQFSELQLGLQLVDRQGPVEEARLNQFCQQVQAFADSYEAVVTFPQRAQKLKQARDLDDFCASVDMLIGLNLQASQGALSLLKLANVVESAGLMLDRDGGFHYRSDSGNTLFSVVRSDQQPIRRSDLAEGQADRLTLLFDVPRVAGGLEVFDYMAELAQQLALALNADLADDNGRALTPAAIGSIRQQLAAIYARMDDQGLTAGGMAALRVFA